MALSTSRNYGYFIPEFLDISEFPSRVPKCLKVGPFLTSSSYSQNSSDMYKTHQKIYIYVIEELSLQREEWLQIEHKTKEKLALASFVLERFLIIVKGSTQSDWKAPQNINN